MPFVKGQSGNPAGRKPSAARLELEALLNKTWPANRREKALINLATMADNGDIEAVKLLMAYTYGRPVERKEITGADGGALEVTFIDYRAGLAGLEAGSDEDSDAPGED
jgi:hypothetical protein